MPRTSLVVSAVALVALVTGALAAPAVADGGTTVTFVVQDPQGTALANVDVSLSNDDGGEYAIGATNSEGRVTGSRDEITESELYPGDWDVTTVDGDPERLNDHRAFADGHYRVTLTEEGDNAFLITVPSGAKITGTITAPSGRPVKHVMATLRLKGENGRYGPTLGVDRVSGRGTYALAGLSPGRYRIEAGIRADYLGDFRTDPTLGDVVVEDYGQVVGANLRNWRVSCDKGFSVSSPKKGQARLTIKATAKSMGLTKPGGRVVVKRGGTTVKTIPWTSAKTTMTLTKQPRGKKVSYSIAYQGGDCLDWKAARKVTIKK